MIILRLMGGLGNQMFQYAYARMLQELYDEVLIIDISNYKYDNLRNFSLNNLNICRKIRIVDYYEDNLIDSSFKLRNIIINALLKKEYFGDFYCTLRSFMGMYYFPGLTYQIFKKSIFNNKYISGYFQSEKYFEPIKNIIKNELKIKVPINIANLELLNSIKNSNSVCIHIRRGDYLQYKSILVCDEKYYLKGMEVINKEIKEAKYFVFSDDIQWIKENYTFKYPITFIENNNPDYEELRLMYTCKHFIISNSSFSWWAQYLSENDEKIVVGPDHWYADGRKTDIYLDSWKIIKIPCEPLHQSL